MRGGRIDTRSQAKPAVPRIALHNAVPRQAKREPEPEPAPLGKRKAEREPKNATRAKRKAA